MTIRSILAATSGGPASAGALAAACHLARCFDAHIECFHAQLDPKELMLAASYGDFGMILDGAWVEEMEEQGEATALQAKGAALSLMQQRGIPIVENPPHAGPSAAWRSEVGASPRLVPQRGRYFDLAVLGRSGRTVGQAHTDVIEQTLLVSGRPVLLATAEGPGKLEDCIAIAWNGSTPAVHALAASLPFLKIARRVLLIGADADARQGLEEVRRYLAWHGVAGEIRNIASAGANAGGSLLAAAQEEGATLLVMGGYGHTPWRELLFGGATREVIATMTLPVLLSH